MKQSTKRDYEVIVEELITRQFLVEGVRSPEEAESQAEDLAQTNDLHGTIVNREILSVVAGGKREDDEEVEESEER